MNKTGQSLTRAVDNMNTTGQPLTSPEGLDLSSALGIFAVLFYVVIFVTSTVGNSTILAMCAKTSAGANRLLQPSRGQFFNHYIANLAVSDLLFTLVTTFDAAYAILGSWRFGGALCRLQGFLVEASYSASILTLVAISRERMQSSRGVRLQTRLQKSRRRTVTSIVIWLLAISLSSPLIFVYNVEHEYPGGGRTLCKNLYWGHLGRKVYYTISAVILFVLPQFLMICTYVKINRDFRNRVLPTQVTQASVKARQRKASRMLGLVTLVFCVLWTPFVLLRTLMYFDLYHGYMSWKLSQLVALSSTATNPFIYSFYSAQFRVAIKRVLTCGCVRIAAEDSSPGLSVTRSR